MLFLVGIILFCQRGERVPIYQLQPSGIIPTTPLFLILVSSPNLQHVFAVLWGHVRRELSVPREHERLLNPSHSDFQRQY
jgi:hypothetical protein